MYKITSIFIACLITCSMLSTAEAKLNVKFATQDFYPFSYKQNGVVVGPGAEIIRTICNRINAECTITIQPWRRSMSMIKKGKTQSIFMVGKNKEREKWLIFSPAIISTEYGFFECTESPINYKDLQSLTGKTIGAYGPSNTSYQLEKLVQPMNQAITVDLTPDDITQFKKLSRCRVDAVYSNRDVGIATIQKLNAHNIRYVGTEKKLNYYIAFSKKNTPAAFIRKFNSKLNEMKKSGELKIILDKYKLQAAS